MDRFNLAYTTIDRKQKGLQSLFANEVVPFYRIMEPCGEGCPVAMSSEKDTVTLAVPGSAGAGVVVGLTTQEVIDPAQLDDQLEGYEFTNDTKAKVGDTIGILVGDGWIMSRNYTGEVVYGDNLYPGPSGVMTTTKTGSDAPIGIAEGDGIDGSEPIRIRLMLGSNATGAGLLEVGELDGEPLGFVSRIIFNGSDERVTIDGDTALINIAPNADSLQGTSLTDNITLYTGRLSQNNINYEAGKGAGSTVNYISNGSGFELLTAGGTHSNFGDLGNLIFYINGEQVANIDLAANFNEANRDSAQAISEYNTQGTGDPISAGVVQLGGSYFGKGQMEILFVQQFNATPMWQQWQAKITITDVLRQGYNDMFLEHTGSGITDSPQVTNTYKVFFDTDAGPNPSVGNPTIEVNTPVYTWLSGLKYYGAGSTWNIDIPDINNCVNNVYHHSALVQIYGFPGAGTVSVDHDDTEFGGDFSNPPDIGENGSIDNAIITLGGGAFSADARASVRAQDPYGTYPAKITPSSGIHVYSVVPSSTRLRENFDDEVYRFKPNSGDASGGTGTGNWNSEDNVLTGLSEKCLTVYGRTLTYANQNTTSWMPIQTNNYASGSGSQSYHRWFYSTNSNYNNVHINVPNAEQGNMKVYIKIPTQTAWLDITKVYSPVDGVNTDGAGCLVTKSGTTYQCTFGGKATNFSAYPGIWMKVVATGVFTPLSSVAITNWG